MFQSRGCLSTMTSRIKRVKEILLPEPRYKVGAMMNDFPRKGRVYDGVLLNFFRSEITENGGGEDSYSWAADELFTEHEAEQLVEWLLEHFGDKVSDVVIEERRTLPREALPFGILGVLGILDDYWMLTFHPKWNLPFQAWAYYDLHGKQPRKFAYLEMTSDGDVRFYSDTEKWPAAVCVVRAELEPKEIIAALDEVKRIYVEELQDRTGSRFNPEELGDIPF